MSLQTAQLPAAAVLPFQIKLGCSLSVIVSALVNCGSTFTAGQKQRLQTGYEAVLVHTLCRRRGDCCSAAAAAAPTTAAAPATAAAARCATSRVECRISLQAAELSFQLQRVCRLIPSLGSGL